MLSQLQTVTSKDFSDSTNVFNQKLSERLAVRLYSDCRPNCLETAALQKGLVLLLDNREVVEEGMGFGVPIVKYMDKTFFPGAAEMYGEEKNSELILTKVYTLDTVSLKKFGSATYIDDAFYSQLRKTFQILYLRHKELTPIFNKLMELRDIAKVKTEFIKVKPRGTVTVCYRCRRPDTIDVHVDFSKITLSRCTQLLVLNEQGAGFFPKYVDSDGLCLVGHKIGAWEGVSAEQAALQSVNGKVSFQLKSCRGTRFFRGLEHTKKRFSWAGLSYSMAPNKVAFDYSVRLTSG